MTAQDICPKCDAVLMVGDWPFCPHGSMHGHHHMSPYEVQIGGDLVTISSLQDANRIERDSMARYRNGEGAPLVFRSFHQSNSNMDKNTLDGVGYKQQTPGRTTRRGVPIGVARGRREE